MKEIALRDILDYHEKFSSEDEEIHKKINQKGLLKVCIDQKYLNGLATDFNVMLPACRIYDQKSSMQCNIYAFLRVIKDNVTKNMGIDINGLDLSASYLVFFDLLEKANYVYESLLEYPNISYENIRESVENYIGFYGTFHFAAFLVKKYGFVPTTVMNEVKNDFDTNTFIELFRKKLKTDALKLKQALEEGIDVRHVKEELMKEVYLFLAKVFGNPPVSFTYMKKEYTPRSFRDEFLTLDLDQFTTVSLNAVSDFKHSYSYIHPVYVGLEEKVVHMDKDLLKKAIVHQLKQGMAVWFSLEQSEMMDKELGILSDEIHHFESIYHIPSLDVEKMLQLNLIQYDHAMVITGAKVEQDGHVSRFLVDDSGGNYGPFAGRVMMLDSFFDKYVITAILYEPFFRK